MDDIEDLLLEEGETEEEEAIETLRVPIDQHKDQYGGDACNCLCHTDTDDERYKTRNEHCVPCSLKFIHGKIFLQAGKTLRPAKVDFLNEDIHSAIQRLTVFSNCGRSSGRYRKRNGNSFSHEIKDSPPKLHLDESDNEDSEDLSSPKSLRIKSKIKIKASPKPNYCKELLLVELSPELKEDEPMLLSPTGSSSCDTLPPVHDDLLLSPQEPDSTVICDDDCDLDLDLEEIEEEEEEEEFEYDDESSQELQSSDMNETVIEREVELDQEIELDQEVELDPELEQQVEMEPVLLPEQEETLEEVKLEVKQEIEEPMSTSDIKDEFVEASSSNINSLPSSSVPSTSMESPDKDPCWTREEDKSILQAFQQGATAQRMLLTVRQLLPERTAEQIMSRFQILLKLLQQMSSAARENTRK